MKTYYCIGKASRFRDGDVVSPAPLVTKAVPDGIYDLLRMAIYSNREQAELACKLAKEFNPVGFVVLQIEKDDM